MAKRFIDTGLFDDDWFMDLGKDAKILWLYFLTKCDHAGMLRMNEKLCTVQTSIKDLPETIKQLGNRIITVSERLYFIPKFLQYQYPGFPDSKAKAQLSAIEILSKYGLFKEGKLTVTELLPNSYGKGKGKGKGNKGESEGKISIDYQFVIDNYHALCPKMSKVLVLNDTRKGYINSRVGEYGLEKVISVLRMAGQSDFLNGINDKAWKADFEWIVRPENFVKVMEGKYVNKKPVPEKAEFGTPGQTLDTIK